MQPDITYISHKWAMLNTDYPFQIKVNGVTVNCIVPAGYSDYNGMSGGSFLLGMLGFGRFGFQNPVSLVHDYIYVQEGKLPHTRISRKETDTYMRDKLIEMGYSKWKSKMMYRVVRIFGLYYWFEF